MSDESVNEEIILSSTLRNSGFAVELYPDTCKLKKQMKYADDKSIPYVVIIGEDERKEGVVTLKNMSSGEQLKLTQDELIKELNQA